MRTLLKCVLPLVTTACGCTFGTQPLPDHFEVKATGAYLWFLLPFAEGGIYYDFIGVGWLAHDERMDNICLVHDGRTVAVAAKQGRDGWKLTGLGQRMVAKEGWSTGGPVSKIVVGLARRANAPPSPAYAPRKRFATGAPFLNAPDETKYLYQGDVTAQPLRVLDDPWDAVVFLVCSSRVYTRLVGFDTSRHDWIGSTVVPGGDEHPGGYIVTFRLRDRRTQRVVSGRCIWEWPSVGSLVLTEEPEAP